MTSLVTDYSSEEDEDQSQRQKDVNYDDVNMEMSDSDEKDESNMFANKEDYKAYKKQFKSADGKKKSSLKRSSPDSSKKRQSRESSKERDERRHRHHHKHRDRDDRRHRHRDEERHRKKRKRRSRSRERSRRSRSRDRRSSRDDEIASREQDRIEKRSRKLLSLGIVEGEESAKKSLGAPAVVAENIVAKQLEAQVAQVKEITGVQLPKYYNPSAINPLRYANQIKKRKLLWSKPTTENEGTSASTVEPSSSNHHASSYNKWESTNFGNSQANEKFRRLMGIKASPAPTVEASDTGTRRMFQDLDQQYERARITTHTARGVGLGFSNPLTLVHGETSPGEDLTKALKK